jgi:hypothetical protein
MTPRWEYASFIWIYSVAPQKGFTESDGKWAHKEDIYVWRPGAEKAEHLPMSDTEDETVAGPSLLDVLNDLGAEGWELVTRETTRSGVGKSYGWFEGSFPIAVNYVLKRPVGPGTG